MSELPQDVADRDEAQHVPLVEAFQLSPNASLEHLALYWNKGEGTIRNMESRGVINVLWCKIDRYSLISLRMDVYKKMYNLGCLIAKKPSVSSATYLKKEMAGMRGLLSFQPFNDRFSLRCFQFSFYHII